MEHPQRTAPHHQGLFLVPVDAEVGQEGAVRCNERHGMLEGSGGRRRVASRRAAMLSQVVDDLGSPVLSADLPTS